LIYLAICLFVFFILIPPKLAGYTTIGLNFVLMGIIFTLASFRRVNDDSFRSVFLGLFLGFFAGIFGLINYQQNFHSFAHIIDRVLNDLALFFTVYGFILNQNPKTNQ
jgi:hypothetical protein